MEKITLNVGSLTKKISTFNKEKEMKEFKVGDYVKFKKLNPMFYKGINSIGFNEKLKYQIIRTDIDEFDLKNEIAINNEYGETVYFKEELFIKL